MTKTQDLSALSLKQLTEMYNQYTSNSKPIKAFSGSKAEAIKRVLSVRPQAAQAKPAKRGSGAKIRELLTAGKLTPAEIVEKVHAEFPESKCTVKDVYWQRNKMKSEA